MSRERPRRIIHTEKRRNGPIGLFFKGLLWLFNTVMFVATILTLAIAAMPELLGLENTEPEPGMGFLSGALALTFVLPIWLIGAGILWLLYAITRGPKVTVEEWRD